LRVVSAGDALLEWYEPRRRAYPWRRARPDPYSVLISEVMLQQTQASRVAPAYLEFMRRFPTVEDLAHADRAAVIKAWNGLGYNRRAVALSEAARAIVRDHGGVIPSDPGQLERLPGVGPYTAAAVACLAYGRSVPALDTNVRRVVARLALGDDPGELVPADVRRAAHRLLRGRDPAAWNQALMDLGRIICRPQPRCEVCPLAGHCRFRVHGRYKVARLRARPTRPPFAGSFRELRGAIVRSLRTSPTLTVGELARRTRRPLVEVADAVAELGAEGMLRAGPAAIGGSPRGRVRLA
jgi:A/G-specific adenine glycosylase